MNRREEVLAELGLGPIWRLRTPPVGEQKAVAEAGAVEPPDDTVTTEQSVTAGGEDITESGVPDSAEAVPVSDMGWSELRRATAACTACELHRRRKQAVLGVGDEQADWLIIGEGPGAEEDSRGEPFVGPAGKLLDNMLRSVGLARGENVYIANVVKCRPPGNRTPSPEEAQTCAPFLDRQIELLEPRLIVALGKAAAHRLLGTDGTLASMRSSVHEYRGIPLIVTYHPAYLLRNMPDKSKAWEDLCLAVETMSALAPEEGHSA